MGLNRRFDLTGLEEPEELWDRLNDATSQVQALSASNNKLSARVRFLERQLGEVGGLSDDELVAELPRRMARALESAQNVAAEIVRRANLQEAAIYKRAEASAAVLRKRAEAEAAEVRRQAVADAAAHVTVAKGEAQSIIADAHARRDQIVAQYRERSARYEREIRLLHDHHSRLAAAYDVVERALTDARRALAGDKGAGIVEAPSAAPTPSAELTGRVRKGLSTSRRRPASSNGAARRERVVYDWSPENHMPARAATEASG